MDKGEPVPWRRRYADGANPATRNIHVIIKTAFPSGGDSQRLALDAGAAAYFTNTDDPHALVAVVRDTLRDARR